MSTQPTTRDRMRALTASRSTEELAAMLDTLPYEGPTAVLMLTIIGAEVERRVEAAGQTNTYMTACDALGSDTDALIAAGLITSRGAAWNAGRDAALAMMREGKL